MPVTMSQVDAEFLNRQVNKLLNRKEKMQLTLQTYNTKVEEFESKRDELLTTLEDNCQLNEARQVRSVLETNVKYIDLDKKKFVNVEMPVDLSTTMDFEVIEMGEVEEPEITKLLSSKTIERIMKKGIITKKELYASCGGDDKEIVAFQELPDSIQLKQSTFSTIYNGGDSKENVMEYKDELFQLFKDYYTDAETVTHLGIKPTIQESSPRKIVFVWA